MDWTFAFVLQAYLLGWAVAVPIGPVNLEIIRRTLRRGRAHGLAVGLGATVVDLCFMVLAGLGISRLLQVPMVLIVSYGAGGFLMGWLAWGAFRDAYGEWSRDRKARADLESALHPSMSQSAVPLAGGSVWASFGVGLAMTTLSPYTIAFWATQPSLLFGGTGVLPTLDAVLMAGGMVWLGCLSWVLVLVGGLGLARHRIGPRFFAVVTAGGGIVMVAFGARFLTLAVGALLGLAE